MKEEVNHPDHYGGKDNPYEAIKVIEAWGLNFNLGNAVECISRAFKKHTSALVDLKKAAWHLNREIENLDRPKVTTTWHDTGTGPLKDTTIFAVVIIEDDGADFEYKTYEEVEQYLGNQKAWTAAYKHFVHAKWKVGDMQSYPNGWIFLVNKARETI